MGLFQLMYKLSQKNRFFNGIYRICFGGDISIRAKISEDVKFEHGGLGTVIHSDAVIESGCTIQHHVTLGVNKGIHGAPHLHKNVFVGPYAILLGPIEIGEGAKIGAGTLIMKDIKPGTIVYNKREIVCK